MQKTPLSTWIVSNQVPHRNPMDHKHEKNQIFHELGWKRFLYVSYV
jgi:hypothetical protein